MANPTITFNDGIGDVTITCPVPRFQNWVPDTAMIDDRQVALGTGITVSFLFRIDAYASFEVPYLKPADLALVMRLKRALILGVPVTVNTEDLSARSYTVTVKPGAEPSIEFTDRTQLEYTLKLQVMNSTAGVDMLCEYE